LKPHLLGDKHTTVHSSAAPDSGAQRRALSTILHPPVQADSQTTSSHRQQGCAPVAVLGIAGGSQWKSDCGVDRS